MSKVIDFKTTPTGNDTGEADVAAIAPFANGETATQSVFNRPVEELRNRTEVLRAEVNENRWVRDADRGLLMTLTTGTLTWNGPLGGYNGHLVLSAGASLILESMHNPGIGRVTINEGTGTRYPSRYHMHAFDDGAGDDVNFIAVKGDHAGAFGVTIEIVDDPGSGTVTVTTAGLATVPEPSLQPGRDDITVTYDSVALHTWADIETAVEADPVAGLLVKIEYAPAGAAQAAFDVARFTLAGGIDYVHHEITDTALSTFFATGPDAALKHGDTLAIWYDTPQLRRESVEENTNKHLVPAASLVNLSTEPDKAAHSIPIGRVSLDGNAFTLANGFTFKRGVATAQISGGAAHFVPIDSSAFVNIAPATDDVQAALEAIDGQVGGVFADQLRADLNRGLTTPPLAGAGTAEGAEYVGIDNVGAYSVIGAVTESVQDALVDIDTEIGLIQNSITPTGTGTSRIESLQTSYTEVQPAGDKLSDTLAALYARMKSYGSIQEAVEASHMTVAGATPGTERHPLYVNRPLLAGGDAIDFFSTLGDFTANVNSPFGVRVKADGRYVTVPRDDGAGIDVYNAEARTLYRTVTTAQTPGNELLSAWATDGYRLAIAYTEITVGSSRIEMYDLGTGALILTFGTSGVFTYSTNPDLSIRNLQFSGGLLYGSGEAADATGSIGNGNNLFALNSFGTVIAQGAPLGGNAEHMSVWGNRVAYTSDFAGTNVGTFYVSGSSWVSVWDSAAYAAWNEIHAISTNKYGTCITGENSAGTDPQVDFRGQDGALIATIDPGATNYDRISVTTDGQDFYVVYGLFGTTTNIRAYSMKSRGPLASGQLYDTLEEIWSTTLTVPSGSFAHMDATCDGQDLYVLRQGVVNPDLIARLSTGKGGGYWVANDPTSDQAIWAASPLGSINLYG